MDVCNDEEVSHQMDRAILREEYLRTLASLMNRPVKIKMHENIMMEARMKAYDPVTKNFLVAHATVPMGGVLPSAVIRGSDVISINFTFSS